jgi:hypothetical protein
MNQKGITTPHRQQIYHQISISSSSNVVKNTGHITNNRQNTPSLPPYRTFTEIITTVSQATPVAQVNIKGHQHQRIINAAVNKDHVSATHHFHRPATGILYHNSLKNNSES